MEKSTEVKYEIVPGIGEMFKFTYWIFAIIYTWVTCGWGWGVVNIFFPVYPLIALAVHCVHILRH